jgi:nephrocystin-3
MNEIIQQKTEHRVIRVFISSTFRDMQAERDELAKFIFPQLRKLCEQRGVTWGEVDLRWGITDEQSAEGKVLPICLDEIQRCRPYFISLLGERYGWIPEKIPPELIEREPWLAEHLDHSVTEMEILHGVLNYPEMAQHAFFYYRDPAYIQNLPGEEQPAYREEPTSDEIDKLGIEEAIHRAEARREKLAALKEHIRSSGFPLREGYHDPRQLGEWVQQDLVEVIERLYPEGSQPDPLNREATEHEAFAISRERVYIGRQNYFDQLDVHADADGPPLVILGESGSGKSALLANWSVHYRTEHPDDFLLIHFIGATPASADWAAMLRRILGEIKRKFNIQEEVPDKPDALRSTFATWLNMAGARGRTVLIIDALNQLDDHDGAPDLVWLPPFIPANVRIILSTLPGRPLDELIKRGWPTLLVEPLHPEERKRLIYEYLALFTKALSSAHIERIANAAQCQNPLFMRVMLDELRLFGEHERLGERIEAYLQAKTIPALYEMILQRCEQDYENDRPDLVGESMSLLWAARRGLSESELMDLLGSNGQPLPRAHWSPLFLAIEQAFLNRGGLIGFFHDYLRQAIQNHYLPELSFRKLAHLRLADYFELQSGRSLRRLDELPWQLAQACEWQRLYILLRDLEFVKDAWEFNPFEIKAYWAQVETNSPFRILDGYCKVIDNPSSHPDYVWTVSLLLGDTGHLSDAFSLHSYLVDYYRKVGDSTALANSLGNKAVILKQRGDLDSSMALLKEQENICREHGNLTGLHVSLGNQANILQIRSDLNEAMELLKEQERISRELGDREGLLASIGNQANILLLRGDLDGAMIKMKEGEQICRELGNPSRLQTMLGNQALILRVRGDLDGAMKLYQEKEKICRELGYKAGLYVSLGNQANVLYIHGDLRKALELHKEEEAICHELGDRAGQQASIGNQAVILKDFGDLEGALRLMKEQEHICRELGDKVWLQRSIGNQALILSTKGDLDGGMMLLREQEHICREIGYKESLSKSLNNQAHILYTRGDLDAAMVLLQENECICRELGDKAGLAYSLGNQALILKAHGNLDGAMKLMREQERLCRELGNKVGLNTSLGNQALILKDRGDLEGAMILHKEEEQIYRELGNTKGLAISLVNQVVILVKIGRIEEARTMVDESLQIAQEHGDHALIQHINSIKNQLNNK